METEFFDRQTTSVTYRALFEMKPLVFRTVAFIMRANAIAMRLSHCVNHSNERRIFKLGNSIMATAKKVAPKAATKADKAAPAKSAKVVKTAARPAAKKPAVSNTAKAIAKINASLAKLGERKAKVIAEIAALKAQRSDLKAGPAGAPAAPVKAPRASKAVKAK